jgi:hypothetical protein
MFELSRRAVLVTAAALPLFPQALLAAGPARPDLGKAQPLRLALSNWLAMLSPDEAAAARFPFDGDVMRRWNFMGTGGFIKPGLRLEEMTAQQKEAAFGVLSSVLSPRGIEKTRDVMSLQQVLIEKGNGAGRSAERFGIAVFGEPAATGRYAMRFEGHHLSLTFMVENDRLTGITPSSFSVNPNRVSGTSRDGLVTLKREDTIARKLAADFSGAAKAKAFFRETPFRNVQALAGRESPFNTREGIAVGDMGSAQRDLFIEIIDAFAIEHLRPDFAGAVAQRIQSGDAAATTFAFAGSTQVGEPGYYRIQGDHVLIEFASVDAAAQHLHTIFHLT